MGQCADFISKHPYEKYILVIIDECAGVPAELWEAAESLASNRAGVILAVGDPH